MVAGIHRLGRVCLSQKNLPSLGSLRVYSFGCTIRWPTFAISIDSLKLRFYKQVLMVALVFLIGTYCILFHFIFFVWTYQFLVIYFFLVKMM